MEDRIDILEKRIEMLEAMVKMLANTAGCNNNYKPKIKYNKYEKYVVMVDSDSDIEALTYDMENYFSYIEDIQLDKHPNVCYVTFPEHRGYEVILITKNFFQRWKTTHRYFYTVTYDELIDELKKGGVIDGCK